ncbi:MAG: cytochrome c biogenesis protein CcsA [Anaerolineae bacterium]|nr:cytochrome c biogenesis protein CcsA [Phycisphaerae bacterium]
MILKVSTIDPPARAKRDQISPRPAEPSALKSLLKPFASLRLTVVLLALTTILVYVGTSVQKEMGIWDVQRKFFHSFLVWVDLRLFFPLWSWAFENLPGRIPIPGGYTLIGLLLINLVAAHTVRFKLNRKRAGIILIHGGLILLIIGEVVTAVFAREGQMVIDEGQTVSFVQDIRDAELAVVDPSPIDQDEVVAIPSARLEKRDTISYPTLPFTIQVDEYYKNSLVLNPMQLQQMQLKPNPRATAGAGVGYTVEERPKASGVEVSDNVDFPSAYVTLRSGRESLGTFLVTTFAENPQDIVVNGRPYTLQLRFKRSYKPYSLTLHDFTHDKYTGTDVPRNFASRVQLIDPTRNENREVKIWMNHPLRYAGETFFQASFKRGDKTTILQVVNNPGWLIPYISCTAISLGLLIHFGIVLTNFLGRALASLVPAGQYAVPLIKHAKHRHQPAPTPGFAGLLIPGCVAGLCVLVLLMMGKPPKQDSRFDYNAFGRVPISYEGRVMPLDTLARVSLRIISNKSEVRLDDGTKLHAINWLADVFGKPERARMYKIFRIDHPDVLTLLKLDSDRKLFSIDELAPALPKVDEQVVLINKVPKKNWNVYQRKMMDLHGHLSLFSKLADGRDLYIAPPTESGEDWKTFQQAMIAGGNASAAQNATPPRMNPGLAAYIALIQSYNADRFDMFNSAARDYLGYLTSSFSEMSRRVDFEVLFNYFEPFVTSIYFYIAAFLVMLAGLLIAPARMVLRRSALAIIMVTFLFHTLGLLGRIYIQGRPPVTNLYSSAIFIGWAAVGASIIIELMFKNGIGNLVAPIIAFPTLVIAHYLAGSGDTMQMLQAVLDTNLWLATHVVAVTMGYAATFLAGALAILFIIGDLFFARDHETMFHKVMGKVIYGILCFALLFSFVGTVLGGIWADQSWGRFWGWDPKENGAVMIVLWNAIVLHARWAGLIRSRGIAVLAIFGNIITGWSWFGTNLMGVGLHSYGFMDSGVFWLGLFAATQVVIMLLATMRGAIPLNRSAQLA